MQIQEEVFFFLFLTFSLVIFNNYTSINNIVNKGVDIYFGDYYDCNDSYFNECYPSYPYKSIHYSNNDNYYNHMYYSKDPLNRRIQRRLKEEGDNATVIVIVIVVVVVIIILIVGDFILVPVISYIKKSFIFSEKKDDENKEEDEDAKVQTNEIDNSF